MGKSETENRNQSRSESLICITQYEKVVVEFLIWRETDKTHTQNERERERERVMKSCMPRSSWTPLASLLLSTFLFLN